jgi:NADH:ubiquinone oxidoreductase subunit B-like Fe-S oxidoreductase
MMLVNKIERTKLARKLIKKSSSSFENSRKQKQALKWCRDCLLLLFRNNTACCLLKMKNKICLRGEIIGFRDRRKDVARQCICRKYGRLRLFELCD